MRIVDVHDKVHVYPCDDDDDKDGGAGGAAADDDEYWHDGNSSDLNLHSGTAIEVTAPLKADTRTRQFHIGSSLVGYICFVCDIPTMGMSQPFATKP